MTAGLTCRAGTAPAFAIGPVGHRGPSPPRTNRGPRWGDLAKRPHLPAIKGGPNGSECASTWGATIRCFKALRLRGCHFRGASRERTPSTSSEPNPAATGSISMEYRGVKYTITQEARPVAWRWRTVVGKPPITRTGEASTQMQAELHVKKVIDWYEQRRVARDDPHSS